MSKWILIFTILAVPAFSQRARIDHMKSFRQELATAVTNGNLTTEEKQKYDAALQTLDKQREARKSRSGTVDRQAAQQAMQDLASVARSTNLKEEDRAKLAKHMQNKARGKGKRGQQRTTPTV